MVKTFDVNFLTQSFPSSVMQIQGFNDVIQPFTVQRIIFLFHDASLPKINSKEFWSCFSRNYTFPINTLLIMFNCVEPYERIMHKYTIKEILGKGKELSLQEVTVQGWVRSFRSNRFIALNDGSTIKNIQIVVDFESFDADLLKKVTTASSLKVKGDIVESQ